MTQHRTGTRAEWLAARRARRTSRPLQLLVRYRRVLT